MVTRFCRWACLPLVFFLSCSGTSRRAKGTLLATGDGWGEIATCGCKVHPTGGFSRRATAIARIRQETGEVALLDLGDELTAAIPVPAWDRPRQEARAQLILNVLGQLHYDGLVVGERDLAFGLPFLIQAAQQAGVRLLSANLADDRGALLFPGRLKVSAGQLAICAVAVSGDGDYGTGVQRLDPLPAIQRELSALQDQKCDVKLLLAHLSKVEIDHLLAAAPEFDLALSGHQGLQSTPQLSGTTPVIFAGQKGRQLERLDLAVAVNRKTDRTPFADLGKLSWLRDERDEIQKRIETTQKQAEGASPETAKAYQRTLSAFQGRRADLEKQMHEAQRSQPTRGYQSQFIVLGTDVPDDPQLLTEVNDFNQRHPEAPPRLRSQCCPRHFPLCDRREGARAVLRITFLGTSAAQPTLQRNLSGVAVRRATELLLFDCGEGSQRQMMRYGTGFGVDAIFFTHFHADHYLGLLGFLRTLGMQGREAPLRLFGPPPARSFLDRAIHLGYDRYAFPIEITELTGGEAVPLYGARVVAIAADHGLPALAYKLEEDLRPGEFHPETARKLGIPEGPLFGQLQRGETVTTPGGVRISPAEVMGPPRPGRSVVLSGDTRPTPSVAAAAAGVDLLIHEATFADGEIARALETHHSTAREAARLAATAGARRLVLTHFSSRYEDDLAKLTAEAREEFPGTELAHDGLTLELALSR